MSKIDAAQVVNRLTLSAILSALREFGITVSSPAQEMSRGGSTRAPPDEPESGAEVAFDVLISAIEGMGISVVGAPGELRGDAQDASTGVQTDNRAVPTVGISHGSPWANGRIPPAAVSLAGDIAASIVAAYPSIMDPESAEPAPGAAVAGASIAAPIATPSAGVPVATPATAATLPAASPVASSSGSAASSPSSEDIQSGPTGFVCTHCSAYNLLVSSTETYYTVTAGRAVGVFRGWHNVQPLVSGVPHAGYKKYKSKAAAVEAFEEAMAAGTVVVIQ